MQEKIENQDMERQITRNTNAGKIQKYSTIMLKRQTLLEEIYKKLNLENNQEKFDEIAYELGSISSMVGNSESMPFDKSCELSKKILESEDFRKLAKTCMGNQTVNFDQAIEKRIKSLIHNDELKQIDEQLEQISSEKIGFFGRISGKKKYYETVKEMLTLQKKEKELDPDISSGKINDLIGYINKHGMSNEIQSFISDYLAINLGIGAEEKKLLEETSQIPIREKKTYPAVTSFKDYRKSESSIRFGNEALAAYLEERQSIKKDSKSNIRITDSDEIKLLHQYVNSIHSLAQKNLTKEIEENTQSQEIE